MTPERSTTLCKVSRGGESEHLGVMKDGARWRPKGTPSRLLNKKVKDRLEGAEVGDKVTHWEGPVIHNPGERRWGPEPSCWQ